MIRKMTAFGTAAAIGWGITVVAAVDMALGNETAINGVLGAGLGSAIVTWAAWDARRQSKPEEGDNP